MQRSTEPQVAKQVDEWNEAIMQRVNETGRAYLSHTRLHGAYTYFDEVSFENAVGTSTVFLEDSPENQYSLRSSMDVSGNLELDLWLRHADEYALQGIDDYTALDVRLAWVPSEALRVSAVARNLAAGRHLEFISELNDLVPIQIEPEAETCCIRLT